MPLLFEDRAEVQISLLREKRKVSARMEVIDLETEDHERNSC
jgi:hypothetical protein